ncbi:MAG: rane protein required for colicin production [Pseudomonadota bacterium]|nr:rane protein required for colicin production [Pseudomonadota bacterium]
MLQELGWIDLSMLTVLLISVGAGLLRGLVSELMSLAGWFVAWLLAQAWGGDVARLLQPQAPDGPLARLAGLAVCFVVTLLCWRLLSWLLQQLVQASPLAPLDRLLGAGFGLLRGVLVLWALAMMLTLTPLSRQVAWQMSTGIEWIARVHGWLSPWLPGDWGPAVDTAPAEHSASPA